MRYFTEFGKPTLQKTICGGICARLLYFLVCVQCRRKDSSRSLSHLLMSFLFNICSRYRKPASIAMPSAISLSPGRDGSTESRVEPLLTTSGCGRRRRRSSTKDDLVSPTTATPARYKTELCRSYEETGGSCRYGDKCQFAHGTSELRSVNRHPRYKTELCRTFHTRGFCAYGPRCHFIHNVDEIQRAAAAGNKQVRKSLLIQSNATHRISSALPTVTSQLRP